MISANEKYNKNYAYKFIDREVKTPMRFSQKDNGDGTITLTAVPTQVIAEGTPLNSNVFMAMQKDLLDMVYPIGRGFIDFTETNYSNYLGFRWERELMGMFPIGANDTTYKIGQTGGSATKVISIDNMPEHDHGEVSLTGQLDFAGEIVRNVAKSLIAGASGILSKRKIGTSAGNTSVGSSYGDHDDGFKIDASHKHQKVGKNQPLNIMPPYKAVYYWKRVA